MLRTKKIQGLQALRAIAAILVLIQHVLWHCIENFEYSLDYLKKYHIGSMGVGIFFVISGFVITLSLKQNKMFLFNRIIRIYPPYWLVIAISLTLLNHSKFTISSFLLFPSSEFNSSYGIPYWTLVYEMFFYLIFYALIIFNFSKKNILIFMTSWLVIIIVSNMYFTVFYAVPHIKIFISPVNIFFIFGVCIALNQEIYNKIPNYQLFLITIIGYQLLQISNETLFHTIQALTCSAILLLFTKFTPPTFITKLGDSSYGLYLIHDIFVVGLISIVNKYGLNGIGFYQLCLLTFVISGTIGTIYGFTESNIHKKLTHWIRQKRANNKIKNTS